MLKFWEEETQGKNCTVFSFPHCQIFPGNKIATKTIKHIYQTSAFLMFRPWGGENDKQWKYKCIKDNSLKSK